MTKIKKNLKLRTDSERVRVCTAKCESLRNC